MVQQFFSGCIAGSKILLVGLFIFVSGISFPLQAQAQNYGSIEGTLTGKNGNPLVGAHVYINALERGSSTDRNGHFELNRIPEGNYTLRMTYVGMEEKEITVSVSSKDVAHIEESLQKSSGQMEEVVVVGNPIRSSQVAAIARQKTAPIVSNVVASDLVGKFPDQNAAAALARIPGIAVERDQGQARYINLRGMPARWTSLAIDGVNVIGSQGRVVRFDEIPAPIIQTIEVNKVNAPNHPAESIAGRVNVQTTSAFDQPGFHISGEFAPGYFELSENSQYNASLGISKTWGDKLGINITGSRYMRNQVTNNIESDYSIGSDNQLYPTKADYRVYYLQRRNNGLSGRVDYRPNKSHQLFLTSTYVSFEDDEQRNQYVFDFSGAQNGYMDSSQNSPDQGQLGSVPLQGMLGPGYYRNSTWSNIIGGESYLGNWKASYRASFTRAEAKVDLPLLQPMQVNPAEMFNVGYDFRDPTQPQVSLTEPTGNTVNNLPQADYGYDLGLLIDSDAQTDAWSAQVDLERDVSLLSTPSTLKLGLKWDTRTRVGYDFVTKAIPVGQLLAEAGAAPIDYQSNLQAEGLKSDFPFPNRYNLERYDVYGLEQELDRALSDLESAGLFDPSSVVPEENKYEVTEDIYSGYLMNTWNTSWGSILAGARLEHAAFSSEGFLVDENGIQPVDADNSETHVFPSLHINYSIQDNWQLRLAGTTGISRADFSERRPSLSFNDTENLITGGNPDVRSERSYGGDIRLAHYLDKGGIISVTGFGRYITDPLFLSTAVVNSDEYDSDNFDRTGYVYNTTLNGQEGSIYGVAFNYFQQWSFLPGVLSGLGLQANGTLMDSEFTTPEPAEGSSRTVRFPGTSNSVVNLSLFFEKFGISARLNYQWRDRWLDQIDTNNERLDVYWQDEERLSASVSYAINSMFTIFANANNLTNELGRRYKGFASRPLEVETFGRQYSAGLRFQY